MTQARNNHPDPLDLDDDDADDLPEADLPVIADLALRRMAQSVRRGRVVEALRWQKLHQILSTQIAQQAEADRQADVAQARAREAQTRADQSQTRDARIRAVLPPNASPLQRVEAELRAIIEGHESPGLLDDLEEVENLEELESVPTADPDDPFRDWPSTHLTRALAEAKAATSGLNRAQRRRIEKRSRKRD